ncbi:hypothetical protein [Tessaracoccus flavus]|uniref:Uncharacterized protein n=1 Tax=Tessaracoccus flavus TaxID=1610493 RepID=A0A1Q2CHF1_9ACTN|nr:hypothetical protein [Tessaracoccus flavus]AQP45537.1 hypothetical protein RPIT_12585 [Tessaracoccus flavus]SDY79717.1 hypothetical protein SAMN05428934_104169 [Tessaracoccus flavus]
MDIDTLLDRHGFLSVSEHPRLKHAVAHQVSVGRLVRLLGDSYVEASTAESFELRVAAARQTYPNGVLVRETAARLSWWPELNVPAVQMAQAGAIRRWGFAFERREIPHELKIWNGEHFITNPALTVLDLTDTLGGTAIDEALRRSAVTLDDLRHALDCTPRRRGNRLRARLVAESRDEPWSPLEREAHVMLRRSRVPGWVANHPVEIRGRRYYLDLAVPDLKLAAEIDGWEHHKTLQSFIADREKWNDLALDGWLLLHFTARSLEDLVPQLRQAYAIREAELRSGIRLTL